MEEGTARRSCMKSPTPQMADGQTRPLIALALIKEKVMMGA